VLPISEISAPIFQFTSIFREAFNHPAQEQHFAEYLSGLIASGNRTVAGIHQRLISDTEYDSLHHFMADSPWSPDTVREARLAWIKEQLPTDIEKPTVIAIDSTFGHHTGENIHGVYWYFDYTKKQFCLAQRVVLSTLVTPSVLVPLGHELYHRGFLPEQKLYLDATMPAADAPEADWKEYEDLVKQYENNRVEHRTQLQIAADLVDECEAAGFKKHAYVLDGAFLDKDLMEHIEAYGQAWVCRLAKNRLVQIDDGSFVRVDEFAKTLTKDSFKPVKVKTRQGVEQTYWCAGKNMVIKDWNKKRVVISYDNADLDGEPVYLISNKLNWTQAYKILDHYIMRDSIEHLIRDNKQELGFEDGQMRKADAVKKHWELAFAAHAFLELSVTVDYPDGMEAPQLETIGQKCRFVETGILQSFVKLIETIILEGRNTKELLDLITRKRLNRLAA
jgi:DDE superfamily endonuclease